MFDEAVSALDVSVQAQVLNLIRDLQAEHRFGALFISHDIAATRYLSHRIAVMREGEIVEIGAARTLLCGARARIQPGAAGRRLVGDEGRAMT